MTNRPPESAPTPATGPVDPRHGDSGVLTRPEVPNLITSLTPDQLKELRASLAQLLDHIPERIHYAESRRATVAVIAAAVMAFAVALLPPILDKVTYGPLYWSLIAFCSGLILTGLMVFVVFALQTNFHYPFTEVTQEAWKWFYRDAVPKHKEVIAAPWLARETRRTIDKRKAAFKEQWKGFLEQQVTGLSDAAVNACQDLQQVYILHVNEGYKNQFLTKLRGVFNRGLAATLVITVLVFFAVRTFGGSEPPTLVSSGVFASPSIRLEASWTATGIRRNLGIDGNEVQVLVNLRGFDQTGKTRSISRIRARDSAGLEIPILPDSLGVRALVVPKRGIGTSAVMLWLPEPLLSRLHHFEPVP